MLDHVASPFPTVSAATCAVHNIQLVSRGAADTLMPQPSVTIAANDSQLRREPCDVLDRTILLATDPTAGSRPNMNERCPVCRP